MIVEVRQAKAKTKAKAQRRQPVDMRVLRTSGIVPLPSAVSTTPAGA